MDNKQPGDAQKQKLEQEESVKAKKEYAEMVATEIINNDFHVVIFVEKGTNRIKCNAMGSNMAQVQMVGEFLKSILDRDKVDKAQRTSILKTLSARNLKRNSEPHDTNSALPSNWPNILGLKEWQKRQPLAASMKPQKTPGKQSKQFKQAPPATRPPAPA